VNLYISDTAQTKMRDVAEFVDELNLPGAGDRWIERLIDFLLDHSKLDNVQWQLCNNVALASKFYSCLQYNGWVIAFRIEYGEFRVYDFIHGSLLT